MFLFKINKCFDFGYDCRAETIVSGVDNLVSIDFFDRYLYTWVNNNHVFVSTRKKINFFSISTHFEYKG